MIHMAGETTRLRHITCSWWAMVHREQELISAICPISVTAALSLLRACFGVQLDALPPLDIGIHNRFGTCYSFINFNGSILKMLYILFSLFFWHLVSCQTRDQHAARRDSILISVSKRVYGNQQTIPRDHWLLSSQPPCQTAISIFDILRSRIS